MASSTESERNLLYNIKNQFTTSCLLNLHDYVATHPGRYADFLAEFNYDDIDKLIHQVAPLNHTIVPGVIKWLNEARNLAQLKPAGRRPSTQQLKTSKKVKPITKFKRFSSRERKLDYLDKNIDRIKSMKHCVMYAKLLDNYIDDGNTDWELFNQQFTKSDINLMIANLKKCPTSASHIIKWLEKAKKNKGKTTSVGTLDRIKTSLTEKKSGKGKSAKEEKKETTIDWLEEALSPLWFTSFEKFSKDKKLEYLRVKLRHITSTAHCKVYAKMLNNYINEATKADYELFRKTFIEKDIKFMITHLKKCSDSKTIVGWLEKHFRSKSKANTENAELSKFEKLDDFRKLYILKINLRQLTTDNCEIYAAKLEKYINKNKVQKNHELFTQAFTVADVNKIISYIDSDYCYATTSDIEWLKKALYILNHQKEKAKNTSKDYVNFTKLTNTQKLQHLKKKFDDIRDETTCTNYVDLLENYINGVKTTESFAQYDRFIKIFTAKNVYDMIEYLNPRTCPGSAIFNIVVWLDEAEERRTFLQEQPQPQPPPRRPSQPPPQQPPPQQPPPQQPPPQQPPPQQPPPQQPPPQQPPPQQPPPPTTPTPPQQPPPQQPPPQQPPPQQPPPQRPSQRPKQNQKFFNPETSNDVLLRDLKNKLNDLPTKKVKCEDYAHMLNHYIKRVNNNDALFREKFNKADIDNMRYYIHKYRCPENTYDDVLRWLTNVLKKIEHSDDSEQTSRDNKKQQTGSSGQQSGQTGSSGQQSGQTGSSGQQSGQAGSSVNSLDRLAVVVINNLDRPAVVNNLNRPAVVNNLDKPAVVVINNLDKPAVVNNLDRPAVVVNNLDRPAVVVNNLDRPAVVNNLDRPAVVVNNLDRPAVVVNNLDRPAVVNNLDRPAVVVNNLDKPAVVVNNLDRPAVVNNLDKPAVVNNLDKPAVVNNLDKLVVVNNLNKPTVVNNLDRPAVVVINNLDKPAIVNNLDNPAVVNNLDRLAAVNNLDRPAVVVINNLVQRVVHPSHQRIVLPVRNIRNRYANLLKENLPIIN